ncbi:hypothetical protein SASPL_104568 [Salvia splendens]|uniref:EGF-like calcium-binding domain-containing protein n=1 Tax=Salvia splendens TaxID=180675 RepID=A0A8X9A8J0_SALSN|nr:hypothetical protein SASPL_104568 [Salvia splendens]
MGCSRGLNAAIFIGATLLIFTESVVGRFVVEKNSLRVMSPDSIKGTHDTAIGNFGIPQYGGSMAGTVVYPKDNQKGCKEFDNFGISFKAKAGAMPNFVLLDRGDCFFALKVWNAQNAGAAPVLVADYIDEALITMDSPEEKAVPHPDDRVEYELWTNSNDECGFKCDMLMEFVKDFKGAAQILENKQCKSQCINHGRYCAPDPEQDFSTGYEGKDVVIENLRQLCVFKVANETKKPWMWWDYVTDFQIRCPMKEKKYNKECADGVIKSLGLDLKNIEKCMGNPDVDSDSPVLKEEQDVQVGKGSRGDVTILPTLVVNNRQYRGKLEKGAVLKPLCAGFEKTTEPSVCLSGEVETNECLDNNGGCWQDKSTNITACKDTFRGRVCECPVVNGVQFKGDGYSSCVGMYTGTSIFTIFCSDNQVDLGAAKSVTVAAGTRPKMGSLSLLDSADGKCICPLGFKGDGVKNCEDVDECSEKKACQCPECSCKNTWGSYECSCSADLLYIRDHDICKRATEVRSAWTAVWVIFLGLATATCGAYLVYKFFYNFSIHI